jgi:hypothetical protein
MCSSTNTTYTYPSPTPDFSSSPPVYSLPPVNVAPRPTITVSSAVGLASHNAFMVMIMFMILFFRR